MDQIAWISIAVNTVINVSVGVIAWQLKRGVELRDRELRDVRQALTDREKHCARVHGALDERLDKRAEREHEREMAFAAELHRAIREMTERFATRDDFVRQGDKSSNEFRRLYARVDEMGQELKRVTAILEERTGGK